MIVFQNLLFILWERNFFKIHRIELVDTPYRNLATSANIFVMFFSSMQDSKETSVHKIDVKIVMIKFNSC